LFSTLSFPQTHIESLVSGSGEVCLIKEEKTVAQEYNFNREMPAKEVSFLHDSSRQNDQESTHVTQMRHINQSTSNFDFRDSSILHNLSVQTDRNGPLKKSVEEVVYQSYAEGGSNSLLGSCNAKIFGK
jgi:hypothetical protein